MVLLSPLGYSPTGEAFNLSLEDVAVSTAIALDADKLIFLMDSPGVHNARGELLREMTAQKAKNLLHHVKKIIWKRRTPPFLKSPKMRPIIFQQPFVPANMG